MTTFEQGESVLLPLTLRDETGQPINLANVGEIQVDLQVFNANSNTYQSVKKYTTGVRPNYGSIQPVTTPASGVITCIVERDHSLLFPASPISAVVLVAFVDPAFQGGFRYQEFPLQNVAHVYPGRATQLPVAPNAPVVIP